MAETRRGPSAEPEVFLHFPDCFLWQQLVTGIKNVILEMNMVVDPSGIRGGGFDETKTNYADFKLNSKAIEEFNCMTPSRIGVNLDILNKVMQVGFKGDQMTMKLNDESATLDLLFQSPQQDRESDFSMSLVNQEQFRDLPPPPNLELSADFIVTMNSDTLHRIINAYAKFSQIGVEFSVSQDSVEMSVTGAQLLSGRVIHKLGDSGSNKVQVVRKGDEDLHTQTFDLKPWVEFTKVHDMNDRVTLYFEGQRYAVVEYNLADVGFLRFYACPKEEVLTQQFSQSLSQSLSQNISQSQEL